ncbi:hypothetical protein [Mycolicibacterium vaccae]|uniref:hypothetical protein n=1 Tax=Mycolicibacterium vaccae TaxID=1810 RepID=UPI0002E0782E|nr:hypothetical protein [Mycolicibacterium vaccae]MCV7060811.1 hypothetical protein [Mycolicibacterium vaccae]
MNRHLRRVAALALASALAAAPAIAPSASADPFAGVAAQPTPPPVIGWTQLGLGDRIELTGANQPADTAIPVPAGVAPTLLTGEIGSIVNVVNGRLDVLDGLGTLLGTVPIPPGATAVPFAVDIAAAHIADRRAKLSFVIRADTVVDGCAQPPAMVVNRLATAFSGPTPDPATVAGFLPGYLDEIEIRVGPDPTVHQQQAALDLVAKLTRLYRPMPVRVGVSTDASVPPRISPSLRVIDIRDGGQPGVAVENPGTPAAVLAVTGAGEQLVEQVGLFADRRLGLAQANSAVMLSAELRNPDLSSTMKTFDQLGVTGQTSVAGSTTLYAGFDVAEFGVGPVSGADVRLKAHYTPVVGGEGSVLVRSGATVLAARSLDASGTLELTGRIPAEAITSNVGLALELRYIPRQECAPQHDRVTFALDPSSTVTVTPGTGNRGGFPVLPMAFTPDFDVAVDNAEHLRFAAQAINLIAQQTQTTLRPRVTRLSDATTSGTGLLVVAGGAELTAAGIQPPILPGDANTVDVGNAQTASTALVDLHAPLGMVQAFTDDGRAVLSITGTGDWSLIDTTFDYVRGLPNRWGSLSGDVVATGIAGETVSFSVNEGASMPHQPAPAPGWGWWAWVSIGVVAVAAVLAALTLLLRRQS